RAAGRLARKTLVAGLIVFARLASSGQAADFTCADGDVACLITAIRTANGLDEPSVIRLTGTHTLMAVDNQTDGPSGLPSVIKNLTLLGSGVQSTIIERAATAPDFRLLHVAPTGALTLEGLTVQGGRMTSGSITLIGGGGV